MEDITIILLLASGLSLIFTLFVTPRVVKVAHALKLYDLPDDERKIHKLPIPRLGGMMFLPIMMVTMTIRERIDCNREMPADLMAVNSELSPRFP